jgi:CubicO group peptidase (beta-lactamase class C family)
MARWAMANLNRGELDGQRILKSSTYDVMCKPAADVEFCRGDGNCRKPGIQVGISWFIETKEGHQFISHSGGDDGFISYLLLAPDLNMALVVMQNSEHPGMTVARTAEHAALDFFLQQQKK